MILLFSSACGGQSPDVRQQEEPTEPPEPTQEEKEELFIGELIDGMSLDEQVAQLFILSLSAEVTGAGGYILFSEDISTVEGTRALTDELIRSSKVPPIICIDEEGGAVSRLASAKLPGYTPQQAAQKIGATGDVQNAYSAGEEIGKALADIGVSVNFAPVADVLVNSKSAVIGNRSFGSDPLLVSDMASAFQAGLHSAGVMATPKHFPGHGGVETDPHIRPASIERTLGQLSSVEYKPFDRLIGEGAKFIMAGHIIALGIEPNDLPATLSGYFLTNVLRGELGFSEVVVTDAMNMGAITNNYASAEAAVMAIKAGADMILMPEDYHEAKDGVLQAVSDGSITSGRIRESLSRILRVKLAAGLIQANTF